MSEAALLRPLCVAARAGRDRARRRRRPERLPPPGRLVRDARDGHLAHAARDRADEGSSIEECRARGVPIVWTRHGTRGLEDGGPFMQKRLLLARAVFVATPGATSSSRSSAAAPTTGTSRRPGSRRSSRRTSTDPAGARRRDGVHHRRPHEPVHRRDVQGRALPRLPADRRRGVRRDRDTAPARARARDDPRRLGPGGHARADPRRAPRLPGPHPA